MFQVLRIKSDQLHFHSQQRGVVHSVPHELCVLGGAALGLNEVLRVCVSDGQVSPFVQLRGVCE